MRRRLDRELVRRGLLDDLTAAHAAIAAGVVLVAGATADNPGRLVDAGEPVHLLGPGPTHVSRAGDKLAAALATFAVAVEGRRCLDVGASTGGFSDCLLQHGAAHVVAVDVGRAQLHERLRADARIDSRERTDIRSLSAEAIGGAAEIVTVDVAFVALRTVLPAVTALAAPGATLVLLVKPQFEADPAEVAKGRGVVRDPRLWAQALDRVVGALDALGAAIMGGMISPLRGADGNVEFLLHGRTAGGPTVEVPGVDVEALVAEAVASTS